MPAAPAPDPQHRVVIGGQTVAYHLRRSTRRTIGLAIDHRGLRVGAPNRARLGDIESLIREHGQWVLDKLAAWHGRAAPEPLSIADGTTLSILGEPFTIRLTDLGRRRWQFGLGQLYLRPSAGQPVGRLLELALREHARADFAERLARFAPQLGVAVPPLRLSAARTRWGSCNRHGSIALNWRLIFLPPAIVDYVVCHELAHLKEMNHSPRFWSVVEQLCPDWSARRLALRQLGRNIPLL